jgi:hypothetical protein
LQKREQRSLDGFYPKVMTPTNARKTKSALPKPLRKVDTSDAALMKNKNTRIIGKQFYSCQMEEKQPKRKTVKQPRRNRVKSSNHLGRRGKRPKMDEIRVFPTNQVNMELFSIDRNFIKIKVADQESNVIRVRFKFHSFQFNFF